MVINSPCCYNEELASPKANGSCEALAIPGQMATGKENSNPFMADSLPKTILLIIYGICINMSPFELSLVYLVVTSMHFLNAVSYKLMLFGLTIDAAHLMLLGHKKSNNVVRLQVLIDRKKLIITEDTIQQDFRLNDVDVDDLSSHNTKYTSSALTQKVFANMRRIGKGFSGVDTPLFNGEIAKLDADEDVTLVDAKEDVNANGQGTLAESQAKVYHLDLQHAEKVLNMQDTDEAEPAEVEEVIEVVTAAKLMTETATALVVMHSEVKPKDKGKGILIEEPKPLKRQAQIEQDEAFARQLEAKLNANINWDDVMEQRKPVTEAQPRKNMMIYLKNMVRFKMDFFKGMTYSDIRPIFEKHYNSIKAFLEKRDKEIEEERNKRKDNDDDDVYTKATPLALKFHVVDYQIHHEHNKPYYKIIRADGTHQLFLSFITLLKNFDREDLKMLWKLVQERFQSSEPKNFLDDFLLNTFKIMYEKPNVEAII
nr:hypothetical protein [Tanacetum cinerariifolium]